MRTPSASQHLGEANTTEPPQYHRQNARGLVSVGLPTFNRSRRLKIAIESVLGQDYVDIELVIGDNNSSDDTHVVCQGYVASDKRVRYSRQTINVGMAANFREVLARSRGEYFMWLSDDDSLEPSYISRCLEVLLQSPDASLVCGAAKYYENDTEVFEGVKMNLRGDSPTQRVLEYYAQVSDNGTFYGLMRRSTIASVPLHNTLGGDWLLIASLAYVGKVITLDDVFIRRSPKGASSDVRELAKSLGISNRSMRQPHLRIAMNVAKDIVLQSPTFANLGLIARLTLGWHSARTICRRFVVLNYPFASQLARARARAQRALNAI